MKEEIPEYDENRTVVDGAEIHNVYPEEDPEALDEDEDEGYAEMGIKGGTKEAEAEAAKRKKSKKTKKPLTPKQKKAMDVEPAPDGDGDIDAKDLAKLRQNEETPVETEEPEQEEKKKEDRKKIDPDEYMKALKELEDALSGLDISGDNEEEEEE